MKNEMDADCHALVEESISFEYNKSELYVLFQDLFEADTDFWAALAFEEKNHAALLTSGKALFCPKVEIPRDVLLKSLQGIKEKNEQLQEQIERFKTEPPGRADAFSIALALETSAAEMHFQDFMDKHATVLTDNVFKKLNADDKKLAERISEYMYKNRI